MKKTLQIANIIAFIATVFINYLSNTGAINNTTIGEVAGSVNSLFTPAGYAFSIWGIFKIIFKEFLKSWKFEFLKKFNLEFLKILKSWILKFLSRIQDFKSSRIQGWFFNNSTSQDFKKSRFQGWFLSRIQGLNISRTPLG